MVNNQSIRTLLAGILFIGISLIVMRVFATQGPEDGELVSPNEIRVIDNSSPTIVPPQDDWMDQQTPIAREVAPMELQEDEVNSLLGPPISVAEEDSRTMRR